MDAPQIYATAAGGCFLVFILINLLSLTVRERIALFTSKHLTYPYILHRHRFLGPWTRSGVVIQLIYIALNALCLGFRTSTLSKAGLRAGNLALVNMIPLFAGPHLSFLADILSFRLDTYRRVHRSAGLMSFALLLFHVLVVALQRTSFSLRVPEHLYGMIAGSSLCLLVLLSHSLLRRPSYEIFLRTHQALAVLSAYSIWRHLPSDSLFPRMYIYISAGLFVSTFVVQGVSVFRRNGTFRHSRPQAALTYAGDAVKITIALSHPLKVEAGQYVNLWIPSVSFWSFLQSHPFVVTSWSPEKRDRLDLFVEPRRGLTRELLYHAQTGELGGIVSSPWVLFSGPHGTSAPVGEYESVFMVATGFGVAALLPYLKQLIHGYQNRKVCTRQIRVMWQVKRIETALAMQPLLNEALKGDNWDKILSISVFSTNLKEEEVSFGRRGTVTRGSVDASGVLRAEMNMRHTEGLHRDIEAAQGKREKTLVMVSGTAKQRDNLRDAVGGYLDEGVELLELDYQPKEG